MSCASAIQRAHPELSANASPASRTPQSPLRFPLRRNHNQGPSIIETLVPSANSAMTSAPSSALPANVATNKAEYNKPQGKNVQTMPTNKGALVLVPCLF